MIIKYADDVIFNGTPFLTNFMKIYTTGSKVIRAGQTHSQEGDLICLLPSFFSFRKKRRLK
jgi:hypothetical protein